MLQIFICSTPYHLLLAHLTVERLSQQERGRKRILILTESSIAIGIQEIIDKPKWDRILFLPYQKAAHIYKTKRVIDNWIKKNNLYKLSDKREIFINDDKRWRNQLLITGIKPDKISLIEDGMGAYIRSDYPLREKIYRGIILKLIFKNRLINTGSISNIPADRFFAFSQTAYSWFGENRNLFLLHYKKSEYIKKINQKNFIKKETSKINDAELIILTSPIAEDGLLTKKEEWYAWEKTGLLLSRPDTILIKPHPREKKNYFNQRYRILSDIFKKSRIIRADRVLPAEFLLCNQELKAEIFSPNSTTLANLKSIRPDLRIYHGCDLFVSRNKKINDSTRRLAEYLNQLGIPSISQTY